MADREVQRRLAAVLAADVAGYTRLMEDDSEGTVAAWQDAREDVIKPSVADHSGKIVKLTGDGFLVEFPTVQDAVNCAIAMQGGLAASSLEFRIGINLGDIIDDGEDIHGEGVNIAARLEGLAEPGGIVISGGVYDQVRNRIEADYQDMGRQEVKNVSDPVQAYTVKFAAPSAPEKSDVAISDKPSIAVLPFDNLSGDADQEYFSDGVAEDIITALSYFPWFFVIARNSSFSFKGQSLTIGQIAKELGVRYVLEGSVRQAGDKVRVTAQLIEAETDRHIWAERYDRDLNDIFAVQDEITESVTRAVAPELLAAEMRQARRRDTPRLDTWTQVMRAHTLISNLTPEDSQTAKALLEEAIAVDPSSSMAHADLATVHLWSGIYGWTTNTIAANQAAVGSAGTAVDLDSRDAWARTVLGWTKLFARRHEEAIRELELAVESNPNLAVAHSLLGAANAFSGNYAEALGQTEYGIQLSPRDSLLSMMYGMRGISQFAAGDYEASVDWGRRSIAHRPPILVGYRMLAASLSHLGRIDEARDAVRELLTHLPDMTIQATIRQMPWKLKEHLEAVAEGLRAAGLPEE
ncbi:MAG: adenylate/guanylate cyclase domain-containing protein [Rhodospirillaceae bacterium]|jgi:TolB-like protein|nr:adenylate/guanylate cyclase domain-containing protein [Rhodospirillaceae bacterium]MBT3886311.1 adenylate/guanylate cyclase domain-containing protein [Rhodospirillaceae bacterium]MBT4116902.1 adenylate/guanylate cyclase domain-containing protein [Rhodospirillaceae bacterium]MBT4670601.1 adenylate/guanylate cyclase domain-containing protein [Rhodospirillaceae bacterium]MBT4721509.1 adenylate/guanylate cyclase domain-containing protein [Rhodospirillaceae bacterium]